PLSNPRGAARFRKDLAGVGHRPLDELLGTLVVFEHNTAVQTRQLYSARHDRAQHRLEIECPADRPPDFRQSRELSDRARQIVGPCPELAEKPGVLDRDYSLVREGRHQLDLLVCEWAYLLAPNEEGTNGLTLAKHWDTEHRSITRNALRLRPLIFRVEEDV